MKKFRNAFVCLLTLAGISGSCQSVFRLQGGVNFANVSVTGSGRLNDARRLTSWQAGVLADLHLGSIIYFQTGLLYTGKGSKLQSGDGNSLNYYKAASNPRYLELPLTILIKTPLGGQNNFFVGAGPYTAIGVSGKNRVEGRVNAIYFTSEKNIQFSNDDPTILSYQESAGFNSIRRFDYGLNGTVGIEGKSLVLGVNYGMGLSKLQSGGNSNQDNNNKHRVLSIFLGIHL